jgi:hypothetical protein
VAVFEAAHLDGVLSLCRAEGWPTLPADPDGALRVLPALGTVTVMALSTDGEVVGFAHALSNGLTAYLAELVVAVEHRGRGVARSVIGPVGAVHEDATHRAPERDTPSGGTRHAGMAGLDGDEVVGVHDLATQLWR